MTGWCFCFGPGMAQYMTVGVPGGSAGLFTSHREVRKRQVEGTPPMIRGHPTRLHFLNFPSSLNNARLGTSLLTQEPWGDNSDPNYRKTKLNLYIHTHNHLHLTP